jgi:predicted small lipoprotein YifL
VLCRKRRSLRSADLVWCADERGDLQAGRLPLGRKGVQVNRPVGRWNRLAMAAAMLAALALSACGRKGMLDPPPTAATPTPQSYTSRPSLGQENDSLLATDTGEPAPARPPAARPAASTAPPPPKTFFLDFLLGK